MSIPSSLPFTQELIQPQHAGLRRDMLYDDCYCHHSYHVCRFGLLSVFGYNICTSYERHGGCHSPIYMYVGGRDGKMLCTYSSSGGNLREINLKIVYATYALLKRAGDAV
eukprot:scaffold144208_cov19-Prasinocladus_malaysianus.AAC.1